MFIVSDDILKMKNKIYGLVNKANLVHSFS